MPVEPSLDLEVAYAGWLAQEEQRRQEGIVLARLYYAGEHDVPLTDRQKEFLGFQDGGNERFALNYCKTIVRAIAERLIVAGFSGNGPAGAAFSEQAWAWWQANRADGLQGRVHQRTVRDGEYFVFVDWDAAAGRPVWRLHPRYTDATVQGTGFGCKAFYPDGDPDQQMEYASKRWTETVTDERGRRETRQRMTLYHPDRVEKYILATTNSEAGWVPYAEDDGQWPLPWIDRQGRPLGIPIVHFRNNPDLQTELWDAIPVQDAINKCALDILATADATGFRMLVALGFYPTTDGLPPESDGSNYLEVHPGCWIGTTKAPGDANVFALDAADLRPMIELLLEMVLDLARVTDTPVSRFQPTRQIAAEGTLKQQEGPLLAKVRDRQTSFGNSWEDVLYLSRRLANTFGGAGLDEDVLLSTQWEPAETRDEKAFLEGLALKRDKLGVPQVMIWREAGYSQEEIDEMMASDEYQARVGMLRMGLGLSSNQQEAEESE